MNGPGPGCAGDDCPIITECDSDELPTTTGLGCGDRERDGEHD